MTISTFCNIYVVVEHVAEFTVVRKIINKIKAKLNLDVNRDRLNPITDCVQKSKLRHFELYLVVLFI